MSNNWSTMTEMPEPSPYSGLEFYDDPSAWQTANSYVASSYGDMSYAYQIPTNNSQTEFFVRDQQPSPIDLTRAYQQMPGTSAEPAPVYFNLAPSRKRNLDGQQMPLEVRSLQQPPPQSIGSSYLASPSFDQPSTSQVQWIAIEQQQQSPALESTAGFDLAQINPDLSLLNAEDCGNLEIARTSEEANAILDILESGALLVDPRTNLSSAFDQKFFVEAYPSSADLPDLKACSGVEYELPNCWHCRHVEKYMEKNLPNVESVRPFVRCIHSRSHRSMLPDKLRSIFNGKVGQFNDYRKHTLAVFLETKDGDLLASLIFLQIYDLPTTLAGNKGRVFFECHNTNLPEDIIPDRPNFADEVLREALTGVFELLGKCGYKTAHFRAPDKNSQDWCLDLLAHAKQGGCIMNSVNGKPGDHFYQWLTAIGSRRNINKLPFFDDDVLIQIIEDNIDKNMQKGRPLDIAKMWLAVNNVLKKHDNESFVAGLSHNETEIIRCPCCADEPDCCVEQAMEKRYQESPFDSSNNFADICKQQSLQFDSSSNAQSATANFVSQLVIY